MPPAVNVLPFCNPNTCRSRSNHKHSITIHQGIRALRKAVPHKSNGIQLPDSLLGHGTETAAPNILSVILSLLVNPDDTKLWIVFVSSWHQTYIQWDAWGDGIWPTTLQTQVALTISKLGLVGNQLSVLTLPPALHTLPNWQNNRNTISTQKHISVHRIPIPHRNPMSLKSWIHSISMLVDCWPLFHSLYTCLCVLTHLPSCGFGLKFIGTWPYWCCESDGRMTSKTFCMEYLQFPKRVLLEATNWLYMVGHSMFVWSEGIDLGDSQMVGEILDGTCCPFVVARQSIPQYCDKPRRRSGI